ncbi:MAG: hypothetical protein RR051_07790 [Clostridiales bacterium]
MSSKLTHRQSLSRNKGYLVDYFGKGDCEMFLCSGIVNIIAGCILFGIGLKSMDSILLHLPAFVLIVIGIATIVRARKLSKTGK